jgi:hypothetical protein
VFRYRLFSADGDDLGNFYSAAEWSAGETLTLGDGQRLRIRAIVSDRS